MEQASWIGTSAQKGRGILPIEQVTDKGCTSVNVRVPLEMSRSLSRKSGCKKKQACDGRAGWMIRVENIEKCTPDA